MKHLLILIALLGVILCVGCTNLPTSEIDSMIEALPDVQDVNLSDGYRVREVLEMIDALSDDEWDQIKPQNIQKMLQLEARLILLQTAYENQQVVDALLVSLDELPALEELTILDYLSFEDIQTAFANLTIEQVALLTNDSLSKISIYDAYFEEHIKPLILIAEAEAVIALKSMLDQLIPEELDDIIELPLEFVDDWIELTVVWNSSNDIISSLGIAKPGYLNDNVLFEASIQGIIIQDNYQKEVRIKGTRVFDMPDIDPDKKLTFAYFRDSSYGTHLVERDYMKIDVINYAFGKIFNNQLSVLGLSNLERVLELRKKGVRVVIVIDGVSTDTRAAFVNAASTAANRTAFASSIAQVVEEYQFDGVDLDWEYPQYTTEKNNFSLLCQEIREKLDESDRKLILSAAVRAGGYSNHYDLPVLNQYLDYMHIMTYGMSGSTVARHQSALYNGPYASYSISSSVQLYTNGGFDRGKLVFGIPFYVRMGDVVGTPSNVLGASLTNGISLSFTNFVATHYQKNGFQEYFDSVSQVYYSTNSTRFASYDNPDSIRLKCEWAVANQVAGVMFWDYGHDAVGGTLLDAIYQVFRND